MVSNYLDRCVESVVNQSYSNLEIILVDDGSPDDCGKKCDEWARRDNRITSVHKLNGGLSDARNYGMKYACGEYISFIDSDDYVTDEFFEVLLSTALKHNSDIIECNYVKFYENGEYDEYHDDLMIFDYPTSEGLSALIEEKTFHQNVWNKLYKRKVLHNVLFEYGKQHEDVFWTYQIFGQAKQVTKVNRTMYYYFQRESSIMGQGYSIRSLDSLEGKRRRQLYIENRFPELILQAKLEFFGSCIYMMQCVIKFMSGNEKRKAIQIIRKYKKICEIKFKDIRTLPSSVKKYYYLAKINLYLCCKLRADLNIGF